MAIAQYLATHPLSSTLWGIRSQQRTRVARVALMHAAGSGNLELVQWLGEDGGVDHDDASTMLGRCCDARVCCPHSRVEGCHGPGNDDSCACCLTYR